MDWPHVTHASPVLCHMEGCGDGAGPGSLACLSPIEAGIPHDGLLGSTASKRQVGCAPAHQLHSLGSCSQTVGLRAFYFDCLIFFFSLSLNICQMLALKTVPSMVSISDPRHVCNFLSQGIKYHMTGGGVGGGGGGCHLPQEPKCKV